MSDFEEFPPLLAEIADVIGVDAALRLSEVKGGRGVYIPAHAAPDHWLSKLIRHDLTNALCEYFRVGNGSDQRGFTQG